MKKINGNNIRVLQKTGLSPPSRRPTYGDIVGITTLNTYVLLWLYRTGIIIIIWSSVRPTARRIVHGGPTPEQ